MKLPSDKRRIRYIQPESISEAIADFDRSYAVTKGEFSIDVQCSRQDMEWNQMDQLHRPFVHHTYQKNIRIALGRDFAVSLTRWGKWPFLITVSDMRVKEGLFYQDFVLAGVLFVHNIISLHEKEDMTTLRHEWIIQSHRLLKPLHAFLSRKYQALNVRLQAEDAVIRGQRYQLRKQGYNFLSDPPDFYTANLLTQNTIYPVVAEGSYIELPSIPEGTLTPCMAGGVKFLVLRKTNDVSIWPAACPHEGGELSAGKLQDDRCIECPWHGLKFSAAILNRSHPSAVAYGFDFTLQENRILIHSVLHKEKDVIS